MAATNYPWTEKNNVWRRKLGSMESLYLALASPEGMPVHWMIGCCVSLKYQRSSPLNISHSLLLAWKSLRPDFPNVAATVDPETKEIVLQTEGKEEEWLERSFKVHESGTASELFEKFRSQFCITLHFIQGTNELLIQAPHSLIDGRGILYLYHSLFTALSKSSVSRLENGHLKSGQPNLTRPFDDWLNVSAVPSEKNIKDAQGLFFRVLSQEKPIRLPGVNFDRTPGKPTHRELLLDEKTTKAIISACKQTGVSVTSAWHAALALAVQKIQEAGGEEGTTYAQITTIDLRRYFPSPFVPNTHSIGSLQTGLPFSVSIAPSSITQTDETAFRSLAQSLNTQYRSPFSFTTTPTNSNPDFGFLTPLTSMSTQLLLSGGMPPSSTPSLSSMGAVSDIMQESYGEWDVESFWVSSTMMTGDFQVYCWTFRDRMAFSVCWNEAFYSIETVDAVLEGTREEILSGLKIV